ncbi:hypothetical protein GCM10010329_58870 [Streptomyces spiroverticillatus]|uniref:Uncharacterized protein n=1 Tax=Streptomyces finlayi TaxID=67296 RepID=A0A918X3K5_9ACTN|nr:hypothetical protein [Streptomyces finlayi]GHA27797.1 hypothetical protein GCM10010329_58870 [Streptomyces spiroverticillatus]GHD08815.1 hypothetical protein GCM10010334_62530 [Streptomyces finlayi]
MADVLSATQDPYLRDSSAQVPRGIRRAAHVAALTALPTGLWRVATALGWDSGFRDDYLRPDRFPGSDSFYLIALSVFAELLALLALGLVQRWGEVLPRWVPWLGGRRIPVAAAVVPAALGAAAVLYVTVTMALTWSDQLAEPGAPTGGKQLVMTLCYAPLLLWGPLLAVVTVAYWRRRTGRSARTRYSN